MPVVADYAAYVYVFEGAVRVWDREMKNGQLAVLGDGSAVLLEAGERAKALLLSGPSLRSQ